VLKRRLIPKLQLRAGRGGKAVLVTTVRFEEVIEVGDPVSQAKIYQAQAVDELVFLDIEGWRHREGLMLDVVRRAAEEVFMPITVGGGVRSVDDLHALLVNGADKVSINTAAVDDPDLVSRAADRFGAQCVVVSIDVRRDSGGAATVWVDGASRPTAWAPAAWAAEAERRGAGEILLTAVDRDGTRLGIDIELTREVVDAVGVPVITSGGCGQADHFIAGFREGGADAVASGTYFSFRDENPMQTRSQIANADIPIRLHR
jgi:cyclase